jgi:hypothetical protein
MQINPRHAHLACCTDSLASLMLHMVEFHTQRHDCLLAHVRTHVYLPSLFTFRVFVRARFMQVSSECKSAYGEREQSRERGSKVPGESPRSALTLRNFS